MPKSMQTSCLEFSEVDGIKLPNKLNLRRILWLCLSPLIPFDFSLGRAVSKKNQKSVFKTGYLGLSIVFTYQQSNKIILGGFL